MFEHSRDCLYAFQAIAWLCEAVTVYVNREMKFTRFNALLNGSEVSFSSNNYLSGDTFDNNLYGINIGAYVTPAYYFPGRIADVRIYNRVLSSSEVANLYATTK
jgi:hypothetical protein